MIHAELIYRKEPSANPKYGGVAVNDRGQDAWVKEFKDEWITNGVDQDTVIFADKFGNFLKQKGLTTSQIRNVFGEIKRIQIKGYDHEKPSFFLLKPKMAYAASRVEGGKSVGIKTFKEVFDRAHQNVVDEKTYKNFVDFFEAILAYHKAYGGKE